MATLAVTNSFSAGTTIVAADMNENFDDVEAFVNSTPGVIQNDIVDVKGDIIAATAADAVSRLAVGTNTYVLTADSTEATGLIWAAPTTGDLTGLTAGTNIDITAATGPVPTVNLAVDAALVTGVDGTGVDVTFHSATAGDYLLWDSSEEKLILEGTNSATVLDVTDGDVVIADGTLDVSGVITATSGVSGNVTGTAATVTGAAQSAITSVGALTGLTVGSDGSGGDVTFHSGTAGDAFAWDSSEEKLTITGTDGQTALDVPDGNVTITDTLTVSGGLIAPLAINAQTGTTYTFVLADAGKFVSSSNGSAQTFTVPPNSSVAYATGTQIIVQNIGSANCTLAEGSGVTINSKDSNKEIDGQFAAATLIKTATDAWSLIGALA